MQRFEVPEVEFDRYSNRQLASVPLAVLALALLVLAVWFVTTGSPVVPGIDFTGGTELQLRTTASQDDIRAAFDEPVTSVQAIQAQSNTYVVTFQSSDDASISAAAREVGYEVQSISSTSPTFGADAQRTALLGLVAAFLGMSVLAFLLFRTFVPSIAIVISAFSDMVIPLAVMDLTGIKLSLGTVAALLMLIGYSVDSDILLNNHILRQSGDFYESAYRAMRTGVTMTLTSISAMVVMAIVASLFGIDLLAAIGTVLALGLTVDLMNTYMLNMSLLRWYKFEGVAR
jgi:preprotein translocase subunit SecF